MALNQICLQFTEQLAQRHVGSLGRTATILVVGLAGLIHLSLIREHFEEQFVYGLVFTIMALFQFTLALLLAVRPGPAVYRLGIWGSGLIVLVYVSRRGLSPFLGRVCQRWMRWGSPRRASKSLLFCSSPSPFLSQSRCVRDVVRRSGGGSVEL